MWHRLAIAELNRINLVGLMPTKLYAPLDVPREMLTPKPPFCTRKRPCRDHLDDRLLVRVVRHLP